MRGGLLRGFAFGIVFLGMLLLALEGPVSSCGFHASYFRGSMFRDWERLRSQTTGSQGRRPTRSGARIPGRGLAATTTVFDAVVQELIDILRFVDPYNDAPDSPPWMHTEDGRLYARTAAVDILHEIGAPAVPALLEALTSEIRFRNEEVREAYQKILDLRGDEETALTSVYEGLQRHPEVWKKWQESEAEYAERRNLICSFRAPPPSR